VSLGGWVDYWDGDHPIYVNDRHKLLHAAGIARDFRRIIGERRDLVVLDYGCGEALYAEEVARSCGRLILADAAPTVRAKLAGRVSGVSTIAVMDSHDADGMPAASIDVIVANSLLQYLTVPDLEALLGRWRALLKPDGRLVLADVLPPDLGAVADAGALLSFSLQGGFLLAALKGLARTALSDYRKLRGELGLTRHGEADLVHLLARNGLRGRRIQPNFGHNQARMTFEARPV
jgi:ubiquinone/menaquinone biosynthesis C-methylase UbiE